MSDESHIVSHQSPEARLEMVSRHFRDAGITVAVDEAALREVHDAMDAVMADAEKVIALVRSLAGPHPGPVPQHLLTIMQMGTGYFRHARDTLRRLFVARNAARRAAKKSKGPPEERR